MRELVGLELGHRFATGHEVGDLLRDRSPCEIVLQPELLVRTTTGPVPTTPRNARSTGSPAR
jgi:hypothetical protein